MLRVVIVQDLDGVAIGNHWARSSQSFTASSFLEEYYANEGLSRSAASQLGRPSAAHRFHYFLKYADPTMAGSGLDSNPFIATFDKVAALNVMPQLVGHAREDMFDIARISATVSGDAIVFFMSEGIEDRLFRKSTEERLDIWDGRDAFHWLCDEFCRFIDEGVRTGDAAWPPVP